MGLPEEIAAAQEKLLKLNIEASTGTWDGPDIVDPVVLPGLYAVQVNGGFKAINATATLRFVVKPNVAVNAPIQIFGGYNGEGEAFFKGEVASAPWELKGGGWILLCRDRLARARSGYAGPDMVFTEELDETIIRAILESNNGPNLPSTIQDISSGGWTLGIVDDVVLETSKDGWSVIAAIDEMTEHRTYTDLLGVIRRKSLFANIASPATWTFEYGVYIIDINYTPDPQWPTTMIVNGLAYEGLEITGEATTTNPNLPTPPGAITEDRQSDLVETNERATLSAQYILNVLRMFGKVYEVVTIFNPLIQPMDMVHLDVPPRSLTGDTIVADISHNIGPGVPTTTLTCIGLLNAGDESTGGFAPVASFDLIVDKETIRIAGLPVVRYFVSAVSTSTDSDGQVVSQIWSAAGNSPNTGTALDFMTVITDIASVIELEVTDNHGLVDTASQALGVVADVPIMVRPLLIAAGSAGLIYYNAGQETPLVYAMPSAQDCTAVPLFFENSNPHAGGSAGAIVRLDSVAGPLTLVDTLAGGSVGALFINSANNLHILAGAGAILYRATDGETFVELETFADDINDIQSSPTSLNEIRVCSGRYLYISFDASVFTPLITGAAATTARMMATASYGSAVCFTGGINADCIKFENPAHSVDWSGVVSPPGELRAITPLLSTEGFLVADTGCNLYRLVKAGDVFTATLDGVMGVSGAMTDLMRDGDNNRLAFGTSDEGTFKIQMLGDGPAGYDVTTYILDTTPALQIGYGPLALLATLITGDFAYLLMSWGQTGANDKLWLWSNGAWLGITNPQTDWFWMDVAHDPANPQRMLMLGNNVSGNDSFTVSAGALKSANGAGSPLYYSSTGGATWQSVSVPQLGGQTTYRLDRVVFRTDGTWTLLGNSNRVDVWNGSGASVTTSAHSAIDSTVGSAAKGAGGDLLLALVAFVTGRLYTLALGATTPVDVPDDTNVYEVVFVPASGAAINGSSGLYYLADYATDTAVSRTAGGGVNEGAAMAVMADGVALYALSEADGVVRYPDITAGSTRASILASPTTGSLHVGPSGNYLVLLRTGGGAVNAHVYDGAAWVEVATPNAADQSLFNSSRVEVIEQ